MTNTIEEQLNQLPQFSPPVAFKDQLRQQLQPQQSPKKHKSLRWIFLGAASFACLLLIFVATQTTSNPFNPQPVSASEIVKVFMQTYLQPNTIAHRAYWLYEGSKQDYQLNSGVYRESWDDQKSDRFLQEIIYPGIATEWQGNDLINTFHTRADEKTVTLFPNELTPEEIVAMEQNPTTELDLAKWMNQLLEDQQLTAYPGDDHGRNVYIINDQRDHSDKYWDTYYFDFDSKQLLAVEKTQGDFFSRVDYVLIEPMDRNSENTSLFTYPPKGFNDSEYMVQKQVTDPDTGYYQMQYISGPSPIPTPFINDIEEIFEEDILDSEYIYEDENIEEASSAADIYETIE